MKRFLKKTFLFSLGTFFSRILGFVREIVFSYVFGASFFSDLFFACFRIPNLLRRLLAEGTLSFAYINVYSELEKEKNEVESLKLSSAFFNWILIITFTLYILVLFFSNDIVSIMLKGFSDEKLLYASIILKWVFPFIIFISLGSIFSGFLNMKGSFFVPAVSSSFLNISLILCVIFFYREDYILMGKYLGISVIIAGFVQFLMLFYFSLKSGFEYFPILKNENLKKMFFYFIPGTFAMAISQLNIIIDSFFASYLPDGGYSWLWYSNRIVQFPLAIFGVAMANVLTPYIAKNRGEKIVSESLLKTLKYNSLLLIPITLGIMVYSQEFISLVFHRGKFTTYDVLNVSKLLFYYASGLWFFSALKILTPVFYTLKKVYIPVLAGFITLIVNTILNYILIKTMGASGLSLATVISSVINFLILIIFLGKIYRKINVLFILKIIIISILYTGYLYLLKDFNLFFNIGSSVLVYYFLLKLFNIEESEEIIQILKRKSMKN
ncbi:MAG: murein biosynthesis integral membrane protein MurJ [Candidatus Muirbacterium halophilum]|nr:murein biosynthesis integral membrane protein MurJ [Candidatus Muirbacterium halophilum]